MASNRCCTMVRNLRLAIACSANAAYQPCYSLHILDGRSATHIRDQKHLASVEICFEAASDVFGTSVPLDSVRVSYPGGHNGLMGMYGSEPIRGHVSRCS